MRIYKIYHNFLEKVITFIAIRFKTTRSGKFGRFRFLLTYRLYSFIPYLFRLDYSRGIEWNFILSRLERDKSKRILDIGTRNSLFIYELAYRGRVVGIDYDIYNEHLSVPFVVCDAMNLPFVSDSFNIVTMVSTIEHVGLGGYGTPIREGGDYIAMTEAKRVLRTGGFLFLTTNTAKDFICQDFYERLYDKEHFRKLVSDFYEIDIQFFRFSADGCNAQAKWIETDEISGSSKRFGLVCWKGMNSTRDANELGLV